MYAFYVHRCFVFVAVQAVLDFATIKSINGVRI